MASVGCRACGGGTCVIDCRLGAHLRGSRVQLMPLRRYAAGRPALIHNLLEAPAGLEILAVPGVVDSLVHFINLFETDLARLIDHEPDEEDGNDAKGTPDKEDFGTEARIARASVHHEWRAIGNTKVEQPIRSSGDGHGLGSNLERVDFGGDNPDYGSPRGSKEKDVE